MDLEWREPDRPTERATFTKADALQVKRLVSARELDQDEVTLRGRLVTLSTESRWELDVGDGNRLTIDPTTMAADVDVTQFHLQEDITILAKPHRKDFPGGGHSTIFKAVTATSNEALGT